MVFGATLHQGRNVQICGGREQWPVMTKYRLQSKTLIRHALSEISQDQRAVAGQRQTALSKKVFGKGLIRGCLGYLLKNTTCAVFIPRFEREKTRFCDFYMRIWNKNRRKMRII